MEALPSLGDRRSTGLGQKKLGTAGEEAGDSGRGWIMPGLGSKNSGFYLNGYGGQQWGLSAEGHTRTCALEDGCGGQAEQDSRKATGKEEGRRERLWLSGKALA